MSKTSLWEISITIDPQAEDFLSVILENNFRQTPSVYFDVEKNVNVARIYLPAKKRSSPKVPQLFRSLSPLRDAGVKLKPSDVKVRFLKKENWAESWKKHFQPLDIEGKLLIRPSWIKKQTKPGQKAIVLDPGLSFGTGHHATTQFCLRELVRLKKSSPQRFLDVGTGSGILSIAATKLGYDPVQAFDYDSHAVQVARENARRNRIKSLRVSRQDLTQISKKSLGNWDVICANLIFDLLLEETQKLVEALRPGGRLILAGILATQFDRVRAAYEKAGLKLESLSIDGEWKSGTFSKISLIQRR